MRLSRTIALCLIFSSGCSPLKRAFFNPNTLVPLVGAGIFYAVDGFDEKVSDWATKHHPVFGSGSNARDASYYLKDILEVETYVTAIATSSDNDPQNWVYSKLKGIGVVFAAQRAVSSTTTILKHATTRTRPGNGDDQSFPSGGASSAFSSATLSNRNLDYIDEIWMSDNLRRGLQFGNLFLATSVGWARIEGQAHYPSDVLAGAALGHFLSAFIYDVFFSPTEDNDVRFAVVPYDGGAMAQLSFRF